MLNKYRLWKRLISPMNSLIDEVLSSHSSISFKAAALILFSLWLFIRLFNPHITQRLFLLFYTWDITALLTVPPFKRDNTHTCALPTNRPWFADDVKILACDWPSFPSSTIVVCNPTFNIFWRILLLLCWCMIKICNAMFRQHNRYFFFDT